MAKHLAELRAFPVFLYGQTYMLGVEAWLAAPLFAIVRRLGDGAEAAAAGDERRHRGRCSCAASSATWVCGPWLALVAALPFLLPGLGLAAVFMDASGGSLEPLLYVLLLWATRDRPHRSAGSSSASAS